MKHLRFDRLTLSAAIAALGTIGATAYAVTGGANLAAAAPPPLISAVDCSQTYGGNYLATIDGQVNGVGSQATVTLGSNCTGTPYYLAVYEANGNAWGGGPYPNADESFPEPGDYPQYIYPQSSTANYVTFASAPGGTLTATINLPNSCWQLDVFSFANVAGSIPTELTAAAGLGFPPGVWAESGPFTIGSDGTVTPAVCTSGATTTTTAPTTTTTQATTTTTQATTTTTQATTTTTSSTTTTTQSTTTTTSPPTTTTTQPPCGDNTKPCCKDKGDDNDNKGSNDKPCGGDNHSGDSHSGDNHNGYDHNGDDHNGNHGLDNHPCSNGGHNYIFGW